MASPASPRVIHKVLVVNEVGQKFMPCKLRSISMPVAEKLNLAHKITCEYQYSGIFYNGSTIPPDPMALAINYLHTVCL